MFKSHIHNYTFGLNFSCISSSHWRCSMEKDVIKNFEKFTGKHLCQSFFFKKVAAAFWHRCFSENFAKNFKITLFAEQLW